MRTTFMALIALSLVAIPQGAAQEGRVLTLVDQGRPVAVIVIGKGANPTEEYAAQELRDCVKKISGADLVIRREGDPVAEATKIVIGTPDSNGEVARLNDVLQLEKRDLGRDGLLIMTTGNTLVLAGSNAPGALYATYAFLEEHLGVRWYFPGAKGEYVPEMKTITVGPIDNIQKPAIQYRGLHPVSANTNDPEIGSWMARNRMNLVNQIIENPNHKRRAEDSIKKGLLFFTAQHFSHWLGKGKLFATHPDYFPLLDGKRTEGFPSGYVEGQLQQHNYCLSNTDMVKEVANAIREFVKLYPNVEMIGVNQQDSVKWCECEACKALGSPTDRLHTFLNRLVDELGPVLDNRVLATQAYLGTDRPPVKVIPNPKVVIFYALISQCARHGWNENCPIQEAQKKTMAAWLKYGNKIIAYTYHADQFPGFPMATAYQSLDDMKYYKEIGISGWFPEIVADAPGQNPLKRDPELLWGDEWYSKNLTYYTAAKALWNSNVTLQEIKDDFFPKFYGKSGPAMRKYYDALEAAWHYPGEVRYPHKSILGYNPSMVIDFLNPALIKTMDGYLAQAKQLSAEESDVVKGRVERDIGLFAKWEKRYKDTDGKSTRR